MKQNQYHVPVLMKEVLGAFDERDLPSFLDCTLGAGGHAKALLESHPELNHYIGLDQDKQALKIASDHLQIFDKRLLTIHTNYQDLSRHLQKIEHKLGHPFKPMGILIDLGVSSMQLDWADRGFSFSKPGPLDMRMDQTQTLTAEEIVNKWDINELKHIFKEYGEIARPGLMARLIVEAREKEPFKSTDQLAKLIKERYPSTKRKHNEATLAFQALRIAVNRELDVLTQTLPLLIDLLETGGRLAVISFHSLEDVIVKHTFRSMEGTKDPIYGSLIPGPIRVLTKKAVKPSMEEIEMNPRSRSSRLRIIEKR